ncbi:MAG: fasciclin domain-containing protein [Bacteroidaceae bacterium]|nr:fasciclin domain-containing protein [Bacteroidaceae bacterium]
MKKFIFNIMFFVGLASLMLPGLTSCTDKPDAENYYTFKGQMMSQYLKSKDDLSLFASVVERAGLMDQLSAYGKYTCFAPDNNAIQKFLDSVKVASVEDLTVEECDTLARTHLVNSIYSTSDLANFNNGVLTTQNMMKRNISVSSSIDKDQNAVIVLNRSAQIYFAFQNDSVENGIVQRVNNVITNSVNSIANMLRDNQEAQLFAKALEATGLEMLLDTVIRDKSYNKDDYVKAISYTTGGSIKERAIAPEEKLYGFTAFVVKDEVLQKKHKVSDLRGLYDLACSIYDPMYPEDMGTPSHGFDSLSSPKNPLYRFMAYHLLDRNVQSLSYLTVREDVCVDPDYANPIDWYTTMLPGTMIKCEHLINRKWVGGDVYSGYYINRRYDGENYRISGVKVDNPTETVDAINGIYFYVSDILKFDKTTQETIDNDRIRMDFSTIFPEIMTNNIRMQGNFDKGDGGTDRENITDRDIGFNYFFPAGYLKGVVLAGTDAHFLYRRPCINYYSMFGDEMIANGVFDITFNLPPFPFEGDWQIRLGFAPMDPTQGASRGAVQVFYDGVAQGIPLNMDIRISDAQIYGSSTFPTYSTIRDDDEKRQADFKNLKNKGYYRGPFSVYHTSSKGKIGERFADQASTVRKVLCTVTVTKDDLNKTHTLRIKNVSQRNASNKEAMLDYLEFVPKSVYGVGGTSGQTEDDL